MPSTVSKMVCPRPSAALLILGLLAGPALADIDLAPLRALAKQPAQTTVGGATRRGDEAQTWYERGRGLDREGASPTQLREAADWYRRAAERGHAGAQTRLGLMYLDGIGVQGNPEEAARWFRRAAEAGNVTAQYSLALMYHQGHGVVRDYGEAVYWYESAARQGNPGAMNNLAIMYGMGEGVPQNNVEAYAWFAAAASHGEANAVENRDLTAAEMNEADKAKALVRLQEIEGQIQR